MKKGNLEVYEDDEPDFEGEPFEQPLSDKAPPAKIDRHMPEFDPFEDVQTFAQLAELQDFTRKLQDSYKQAKQRLKGFEGVREEKVSEIVKDRDNYKGLYETEV